MERVIDPCQAVCKFDDEDVCIGCFRKRDEINNWRFMSNDERHDVVVRVKPEIEARLAKEKAAGRTPPSQRFLRS